MGGKLGKNKGETYFSFGEASCLYELGSHKPTTLQFQVLLLRPTQHSSLKTFLNLLLSDEESKFDLIFTCLEDPGWEMPSAWNLLVSTSLTLTDMFVVGAPKPLSETWACRYIQQGEANDRQHIAVYNEYAYEYNDRVHAQLDSCPQQHLGSYRSYSFDSRPPQCLMATPRAKCTYLTSATHGRCTIVLWDRMGLGDNCVRR